jgi:hypothetical protein
VDSWRKFVEGYEVPGYPIEDSLQVNAGNYYHKMHIGSDVKAPACSGTYDLFRNGSQVVSDGPYTSPGIDVVVIEDSSTNAYNDQALLIISFDPDCQWSFPTWDDTKHHGETLFYDPYIEIYGESCEVHVGDPRLLTVPTDWDWSAEAQAIWIKYPNVSVGNPSTFVPGWWIP